jgi:hypothetical protein
MVNRNIKAEFTVGLGDGFGRSINDLPVVVPLPKSTLVARHVDKWHLHRQLTVGVWPNHLLDHFPRVEHLSYRIEDLSCV